MRAIAKLFTCGRSQTLRPPEGVRLVGRKAHVEVMI